MKRLVKSLIRRLKRDPSISPLITITISKSALLHNLNEFKKLNPQNTIFPVLKSNAYGHGLVEVARIVESQSKLIIVDSYFEAETLRNNGIRTPLLIMGYVRSESISASSLPNILYTIGSLDSLYSIKSKVKIHLKIDTGMNRQGILPDELNSALEFIEKNKNIELEGICSHFADSDGQDPEFTRTQIKTWNNIIKEVRNKFQHILYTHLSNTYGHKFIDEIDTNSSRLGLGLYGLAEIAGLELKPALEMKTIISSVKKIKSGDIVGYNGTFKADKDMIIGIIPVGYYEGIDRRLSNRGVVKIKNKFCLITGRVSMNISAIDLSNVENIKPEEEVIVISSKKSDPNSIENIAKSITEIGGAIPYEIAVHIPAHLKRVVIE